MENARVGVKAKAGRRMLGMTSLAMVQRESQGKDRGGPQSHLSPSIIVSIPFSLASYPMPADQASPVLSIRKNPSKGG